MIETDICVYGGTGAGVVAAIEVARLGRSVTLVEAGQHIGGMNVEGLGDTDINLHPQFKNEAAVGGLAREFYRRVGKKYGKSGPQYQFEPHAAETVFNEWVAEHQIPVYHGCRLAEVRKQAGRITEIRMESGAVFRARLFIDATIEGDLLAGAGVTTIIGREPNAQYAETNNGIRGESTFSRFAVRVDPYRVAGHPGSGVIPTVQDEPLGTPGAGDHRIQAYCFRLCLTNDPANRIPFAKPAGYDPDQYEIYRRYLRAGGQLFRPHAQLPNHKTDLNGGHDLSTNLYGMNHDYPGGSYATRERLYREHLAFTQGLCWLLANDPDVPEPLRREWSQWGVCRDEFTDNAGWPRQLYVRDARRMVSDYVITEHHTRRDNPAPVSDPVAAAYWPPDLHHVRRIIRDDAVYNEGSIFGGSDWRPFGISYRALVPRASECLNLITPTCPSSSHVAYGAIRLEWTFMALGQAAGAAAALAVGDNRPVQEIDYGQLREGLLAGGQVLAVEESEARLPG